ncbi:MAG TPA: endonuclease domain-containing protein [Xanthobacteraceae bacterium]
MHQRVTKARRLRARRFRQTANDAEQLLWGKLRRFGLEGSHFRRQVPIGPYVADFACLAARVIIELDGSQHGTRPNALRDDARTRWLHREGYRVIRVWNNEIIQNMDGVLERIYAELFGSLHAESAPLKHRRGKRAAMPVTPPRATLPLQGRVKKSRANELGKSAD